MFSSGFGSSGFGGQQQQNAGFGSGQNAFGSTTGSFGAPSTGFGAASTGFGAPAQNTGFGAAPATNAFGSAPATTGFGGGGFGGSTTGFGAQTQPSTGFGGSSFGATNPASTTGGFGGFGTNTATAGGFGSGSGFGAKPATTGFGAQPTAGFGAAANTGFGGATSSFGGGGMLGGGMGATSGTGTVNPPFAPFIEKEPATGQNSHYQSITAMPQYRGYSFEELRLQDYQQGRKFPGQAAGFGGTSTFGQQPAATGFGAQPSTGFGSNSTTSNIGGFGGGTTGFGGTTTAGFGSTTPFGSTAPASTGFGGQTTTPSTGFGATTGAFGSQPATGFGATSGTGGFGTAGGFGAATAAKPATGFGGFGTTATSQPATGFGATTGGFGATTATPSLFGGGGTGTGAFGAPAATTSTGFGGFGTTQTSAAPASTGLGFGLGGAAGGFGAKPATSSLFGGNATSTSTAPSFGSFGTAPAAGTGGLFGGASTGSSLFPATSTASTGLFGGAGATAAPSFGATTASTGLFGAKPATTGSLFAPAASTGFGAPAFGAGGASQSTSLFGGAGTTGGAFGSSTLGSGFLGGSSNAAAAQPAMVASVNGNIYGDNPLFQRDTSTPASKPQPAVLSRSEPSQKLPAHIPPVRFSPRHTQIRLRPTSTATFSSNVAGGDLPAGRKSILLLEGINDDSTFSSDEYTPRRSVKKLQLKPRGQEAEQQTFPPHQAQRTGVTFNPSLESAAIDSLSRGYPNLERPSSANGRPTDGQGPVNSNRHENSTPASAPTENKIEGEYWMTPSLEELRKMSRSELQHVQDFKVGLPGYGSVSFLEPVDLSTVPSLSSICGHIVLFQPRICIVYPDEHNKPPRGQGMNVPALISLENCWPVDKSTREPVKFDKTSPQYAQHLKRLKRQSETTFIDFNTDDGTWTFRVEHFSKYGLEDDEYEDAGMNHEADGHRITLPAASASQRGSNSAVVSSSSFKDDHTNYHSESSQPSDAQYEPARNVSRLSKKRDPQRLNILRTSLFADSNSNQDRLQKRSSIWSTSSDNAEQTDSVGDHVVGFGAELADSGSVFDYFVGFRANKADNPDKQSTSNDSSTVVQLMKVKVVADPEDEEVLRHIICMQAFISGSSITLDENNEPRATIVAGTSFTTLMSRLKELQHNLSAQEVYAWILGQSLFDPQPTPTNISEMPKSAQESYESIGRRTRCGNWLSYVLKPLLEADMRRIEIEGGPLAKEEAIFSLLASNKRQMASVAAVQSKNLRLATLIAQSGRGSQPLLGLENQMKFFKELGIEGSIPVSYLKIYALLSGALDVNIAPKGSPAVYVTDGLDWRQVFGLYLWHNCIPGANLQQAVDQYAASMAMRKSVARPAPWHQKNVEGCDPEHYDFLFQLIVHSTLPSKALEDALHPLGMTPASLDYRQSWIFYMLLCQSLQVSRFRSEASHAKICQNFLFQLENLGLWEWAVFVALHLESASSRETAVRHLLERHVDLPVPPSTSTNSATAVDYDRWEFEGEKNTFLINTLRIPETWLWNARATRAKYQGELFLEVFSLLKGGEHQKGHSLILSSLAPVSILQGDLRTLGKVLNMVDQNKVYGWETGGSIYQEYLECCSDFEGSDRRLEVKSKVSYANDLVPHEDIQALQDEVQVLLTKLPLLLAYQTKETPSLQACVAEMASKCTNLLRDLKDLSIQESASLADLPLNEDERMSTVQKISTDYFDEILKFAETSAY
ncbi:hypothetical protein BGZ80_007386 [Entomortierella chlamydospora]|uniref:Peptidase S59 domain-containing protein n=1 Tax=Entomortierella chlamydospora TaxID=101097 RepID=A0A9P6MYT8_9FUNG|nr:hypothetical protein BGZ80_007386 [Entomortierella chlamydospora]